MAAIISSYVYTLRDQGGNARTEGWFLWEFRDIYSAGGIVADLSSYFRFIEKIQTTPASGVLQEITAPSETDLPDAGGNSARILVLRQGGSGTALSEISAFTVSGARVNLHVIGY